MSNMGNPNPYSTVSHLEKVAKFYVFASLCPPFGAVPLCSGVCFVAYFSIHSYIKRKGHWR